MSTARYEKIGVGSVEINFEGLARLLGGEEPGGMDRARRCIGQLSTIMGAVGLILPHLSVAMDEIIRHERERGDYETPFHIPTRTPEEEERLVEKFRMAVEKWRDDNVSAELLAEAARVPIDRGPGGGAARGGGGAQAGQGQGDQPDG